MCIIPNWRSCWDLKIFHRCQRTISSSSGESFRTKVERGYDLDDVLYRYEMHVCLRYEKYNQAIQK